MKKDSAQKFFGISDENWNGMTEIEKESYRTEMREDWDGKYYIGGK